MKEITKKDIVKFGAHLKENYIPIENNYVPNDFISFVLNCHNDVFFDFFNISSKKEDINNPETRKQIRDDVTLSLFNEISTINQDFYHDSLEQNSFIDLEEVILSLGFDKFDTYYFSFDEELEKETAFQFIDNIEDTPINVHFKERKHSISAALQDRMIYYYHKEFGLLWEVQTHNDHYVSHSVVYGNIEKKSQRQGDLNHMTSQRLSYSNIYGFFIDMKVLPLYKFDNLIIEYKFIKEWVILPYPDFKNSRFFHGLSNKYNNKIKIPSNMIDSLVQNMGDEFFKIEDMDFIYDIFIKEYPSVRTDFLLIDLLFDGYTNAQYFVNYINKIGSNPFWTKEKIWCCAFWYFKNIKSENVGNYKNDDVIIEFLSHFDKIYLKKLYDNQSIFVNSFRLSDIVLSYIELRLNDFQLH